MRRRTWLGAAILAAMASAAFPTVALAAPGNDDVAAAAVVTTPLRDTRETAGATLEAGEPQPSCGETGATVWYSMSASVSAKVTVSTVGSKFDTVLGVYRDSAGSPAAELACSDDLANGALTSTASFVLRQGESALIQVGGFRGASGLLKLAVDRGTGPVNDDFELAEPLGELPAVVEVDFTGATLQEGEDCGTYYGSRTLWYSVVAPGRQLTLDLVGLYGWMGVYTGDELASLDPTFCGSNYDTRYVSTTPGQLYWIQVLAEDYDEAGSNAYLVVDQLIPPENDNFADAAPIAVSQTVAGTTYGATEEQSESSCYREGFAYHDEAVSSVWWRFDATEYEDLVASTAGSEADTVVGVWEGDDLGSLSLVSCNGAAADTFKRAQAGFTAAAGTTYWIQVHNDSWGWDDRGAVKLRLVPGVAITTGSGGVGVAHDDGRTEVTAGAGFIVGGGADVTQDEEDGGSVSGCAWAVLGACVEELPLP